jgi:hypothetical protein
MRVFCLEIDSPILQIGEMCLACTSRGVLPVAALRLPEEQNNMKVFCLEVDSPNLQFGKHK